MLKPNKKKQKSIIAYVDGSHIPRTNYGGVGIVVLDGGRVAEYSLPYESTSSLEAELQAIMSALIIYSHKNLIVKSDCKVAINLITKKRKSRKPRIKTLVGDIHTIFWSNSKLSIRHVYGHRKNYKHRWQRLADKLAKQASKESQKLGY